MFIRILKAIGLVLMVTVAGCQSLTSMDEGNVDARLVGSWIGDYIGPDDARGWRQVRLPDGTFYIDFIWADLSVTRETGRWWVADGRFYEILPSSDRPDVYEYQFNNEACVRFSLYDSPNKSITSLPETYTFIDCKDGRAFPSEQRESLYPAQSISKIIARSLPVRCNYPQLKSSGLELQACSALLKETLNKCAALVTDSEDVVVDHSRVPLFLSRYVICTEAGLRKIEYSNSQHSALFDQFIGN
jgi:hypothetical protein